MYVSSVLTNHELVNSTTCEKEKDALSNILDTIEQNLFSRKFNETENKLKWLKNKQENPTSTNPTQGQTESTPEPVQAAPKQVKART